MVSLDHNELDDHHRLSQYPGQISSINSPVFDVISSFAQVYTVSSESHSYQKDFTAPKLSGVPGRYDIVILQAVIIFLNSRENHRW